MKFPRVDLTSIAGVLIDLDNTLYDYDACHSLALNSCYNSFRNQALADLTSEEFCFNYRRYRNLITARLQPQASCRSRLLSFQKMFEDLNLSNNWELALKFDEIYWDSFINAMTILPEAFIFLQQCAARNIAVCIVTDMTVAIQIRKLQKLALREYIAYLVTSEEVGVEKPSSLMFEAALGKLQLQASQVIMIGDNREKDIKGAARLGIKTYEVSLT